MLCKHSFTFFCADEQQLVFKKQQNSDYNLLEKRVWKKDTLHTYMPCKNAHLFGQEYGREGII